MIRCRIAALLIGLHAIFAVQALAQDNPVKTILFGSMEAGPSSFVNAGAKIALDDVNREGFVALVGAGTGIRQEKASGVQGVQGVFVPTLVRTTLVGAALGGYQFFREWGAISLFAGPEAAVDALTAEGTMRTLPPRFGLRVQAEAWIRPSENTLTTLTLVLGSARGDAYGRVSAGYRLWGAYLGPEAVWYGDRTGYEKICLGAHATDFALGGISLRASVGALYEPQTGLVGPYVALAAWAPFTSP